MKKTNFIDITIEPERWTEAYLSDIRRMNEGCKRPKDNKLTTNKLERAANLVVGPASILIGKICYRIAKVSGDKKYLEEAQAFIDMGTGKMMNNYRIFHNGYDTLHPKIVQEATA